MNLRKPCELHGKYDKHPGPTNPFGPTEDCPGGEPATLDDLIAAISEMGVEGKVRVSYIGPEQAPVYVD